MRYDRVDPKSRFVKSKERERGGGGGGHAVTSLHIPNFIVI